MDGPLFEELQTLLNRRAFHVSGRWAFSWWLVALNLMRAADKLFDIFDVAQTRSLTRFVADVQTTPHTTEGAASRILEGHELEAALDERLLFPYLLLAGFALENALKGILVARNPEYVTEAGEFTKKGHKLLPLHLDCGFSPTKEEIEVLKELTMYTEWRGRYPIPLVMDNMRTQGVMRDSGKLRRVTDRLFEQAMTELDKERLAQKPKQKEIFETAHERAFASRNSNKKAKRTAQ